jgi:hypothetical protein
VTDKKFAKDVAKELDRRQRRRKLVVLGGGITAIVLAVMYLRCGHGWGLGGEGAGSGPGSGAGSGAEVAPKRCEVRVAKAGITVDGHAATREQVVAACKPLGAADVVVTGDAREGDWEDLRKALEAAKVDIALRRPR